MLDHLTELVSQIASLPVYLIFFASLGLSFAGSVHCVAMCGVFCFSAAKESRTAEFVYHIGRGFSYLLLGTLAGYLGEKVILKAYLPILVGLIVVSVLLTLFSFEKFKNKTSFINKPTMFFLKKATKLTGKFRAFVIGLLSGALPCGWLHVFILTAVASQNLTSGALILFAFWLGTIPLLSMATHAGRSFYTKMNRKGLQAIIRICVVLFLSVYGAAIAYHRINSAKNTTGADKSQLECH